MFSILRRALRSLGVGLSGFAFVYCGVAIAQTAPAFEELYRRAATAAPRLLEDAADVRAAEARARQAATWPNPQLSLETEDFAGNGPYRNFGQAQTTLSLSEPLELGGQRSARILAGRAEANFYALKSQQARVEFGYELAMAYAEAEAAQGRVALLVADLERSQEDLRVARALVGSGKESDLRALQAESALAGVQADVEAGRADVIARLGALSTLAGASETYSGIGPSLLERPATPALGRLISQSAAPAVATAQAEREAAELQLRVEQKRALPVVSLSVGVRRIAGDDATAMVGGISVAVPLFDRNRSGIAASRAQRDAADARLVAARLQSEAGVRTSAAQATAVDSRVAAADRGVSVTREAYRLARVGYEAGRTPLIELLATRRALTEAQLRVIDARLARVQIQASIARFSGRIPFAE
ncbi:MAG: TolC family protein [Steroidobacteraceae bacterium]